MIGWFIFVPELPCAQLSVRGGRMALGYGSESRTTIVRINPDLLRGVVEGFLFFGGEGLETLGGDFVEDAVDFGGAAGFGSGFDGFYFLESIMN